MVKIFRNLMIGVMIGGQLISASPQSLYAYVGEAEKFDEFEEERLEEFHEIVLEERKLEEIDPQDDYVKAINEKRMQLEETTEGEVQEVLSDEIEMLRRKLLEIPKRDLLAFELVGDYTYDSNINRQVPRQEKGDSIFNAKATMLIDLSGRKTDFRTDASYRRQWNVVFSEKDTNQSEKRFRFRRKFFRKLNLSANSRIAKTNTKTVEIDGNKIRWDFNNQLAVNYPISKKLSFNSSFTSVKRLFRQEAFDQDSGWQVTAAPSLFWSITPKSRASLGYSFGASRNRVKSGDTNAHNITLNYFGQLTRKSSASITLAYSQQNPRSEDTAQSKGVTAGIGTIWQMTGKTQLTAQYTRAQQNTTSEIASGEVDGVNTVTKTDTHFTNDNFTLSLNSRLMKRLTAVMSVSAIHTQTKTFDGVSDEVETRQFSFPTSVSVSYAIKKWATLQFIYRFAFRTGNEKADTSRAHTWLTSLRMVF